MLNNFINYSPGSVNHSPAGLLTCIVINVIMHLKPGFINKKGIKQYNGCFAEMGEIWIKRIISQILAEEKLQWKTF